MRPALPGIEPLEAAVCGGANTGRRPPLRSERANLGATASSIVTGRDKGFRISARRRRGLRAPGPAGCLTPSDKAP